MQFAQVQLVTNNPLFIESSDCLKTIYVWAYTSTIDHSDSDESPTIEIAALNQVKSINLPDLPEDDYTKEKVDMFPIPMEWFGFSPSCVHPSDIVRITIVEDGDDGWNIGHILVAGVMDKSQHDMLAENMSANRWIDGDGGSADERFDLDLADQFLFQ